MANYVKFNSFVEKLAEGLIDLDTDQIFIALTNSSLFVENSSTTADITDIDYTNLSSRDVTVVSSEQTGGTYKLVLQDLTLTASGAVGPFRHVILCIGAGNHLIARWDNGSSVTMASGDTFLCNFDGINGVLQIA